LQNIVFDPFKTLARGVALKGSRLVFGWPCRWALARRALVAGRMALLARDTGSLDPTFVIRASVLLVKPLQDEPEDRQHAKDHRGPDARHLPIPIRIGGGHFLPVPLR